MVDGGKNALITVDYRPRSEEASVWEVALGRVTAAEHAAGTDDCRLLLEALGLAEDAGPLVKLADLPWRPDLGLKRRAAAPPATAPVSDAVLRSRAAAKKRRRDAAADHLRSQGLRGPALRAALARLES